MADNPPGPLEQWTAVDRYITDLLVRPDPVLDEAQAASVAAGLPWITVSARAAIPPQSAGSGGMLAAEPRVSATALQTVGSKGYDGFALLLVTA